MTFRWLMTLAVLFNMQALPVDPASSAVSPQPSPADVGTASPGSTPLRAVRPPEASADLERAPSPDDALVEHPHAGWVTLYGSEAGRRLLPPRQAPAEFLEGPAVPLNDGAWQQISLPAPGDRPTSSAAAPDGRLFVGSSTGGLRVYGPDATGRYGWTSLSAGLNGLISDEVTALAIMSGELWVGTAGSGISILSLSTGVWRQQNLTNHPALGSLIHRMTVAQPPTGPPFLWVAGQSGAAKYQNGGWSNAPTGLPTPNIFDIAVHFSGTETITWFASPDSSGLVRWDGVNPPVTFGSATTGPCQADGSDRIVIDAEGFLWFSVHRYQIAIVAQGASQAQGVGQSGLCRFARSTVFNQTYDTFVLHTSASPGLPSDRINDLTVDSAGRLWIATARGGALHETIQGKDAWKFYPVGTPISDVHLTTVLAVGEAVWFGALNDSVLRLHTPGWLHFSGAETGAAGIPGPLYLESNTLWIGLGSGIASRSATGFTALPIPGLSTPVTALAREGGGLLWIGTAGNGLYSFDGTSFIQQAVADGVPSNDVRTVHAAADGRLWVGTSGGIALRANGYWVAFSQATSPLPSNDVRAVTSDKAGKIWIGTGSGIAVFDPSAVGVNAWSFHSTASGLPSNGINALVADPAGDVWAGTDGGAARFSAGAWTTFTVAKGDLPGNRVLSITSDPAGRIRAGTTAGLALRDSAQWRTLHLTGSALGSDAVGAVAADDALLWSTAGGTISARAVVTRLGSVAPQIASIVPLSAVPVTVITLTGTDFDPRAPERNRVSFTGFGSNRNALILTATSTSLVVLVPRFALSGPVTVQANGLVSQPSVPFSIKPAIDGISGGDCFGPGSELKIGGRGFVDYPGGTYTLPDVAIGSGPFRPADAADASSIRVIIRPGDVAGPVRVRQSGSEAISAEAITVAQPAVSSTSIQQGIQGATLRWGKRTVVQVAAQSGSSVCDIRITGGEMLFKWKDGSTTFGSRLFLTGGTFVVPAMMPNARIASLRSTVNFVLDFDPYAPLPRLDQFDGVRFTLQSGAVGLGSYDLAASAFGFASVTTAHTIYNAGVLPRNLSNQDFYTRTLRLTKHLQDVARMLPYSEGGVFESKYSPSGWLHYPNRFIFLDGKFKIRDGDDTTDETTQIWEDLEDYRDYANDHNCEGPAGCGRYYTNAVAMVDPDLAASGDGGGISHLGKSGSIAFMSDGRGAMVYAHEYVHSLGLVSKGAANYWNYPGAGGDNHSKYDNGDRVMRPCDPIRTFRAAVVGQLGAVSKVFDTGTWNSPTPKQFWMDNCAASRMPRSILSYADGQTNRNAFFEALDAQQINALDGNRLPKRETERGPAAGTMLRLAGSIGPSSTVSITQSYLVADNGGPVESQAGDYHVIIRDGADGVLLDRLFGPASLEPDHDSTPAHLTAGGRFSLRLPFPAGGASVEISRGGQTIWLGRRSANAPALAITAPGAGRYPSTAPIDVQWTASDADGDPIRVAIEYSTDSGQTWEVVATGATGGSYRWLPLMDLASTTARLRLTASDGFNTTSATSAELTLLPHPPAPAILSPEAGLSVPEGASVRLEGTAITSSGVGAGAYRWALDGVPIGAGRLLSATSLAIGRHTLGLTVESDGLSGSTAVMIDVVADYDHDGLPDSYETAHRLSPLDPSDATADLDSDGLNGREEYELRTDPRRADTDGDGAGDGLEIAAGTDPLDPAKLPPTGPVLLVGGGYLMFTARAGGPVAGPTSFYVANLGTGTLTPTITASAPWVVLAQGAATAPFELQVSVNPKGLTAGVYRAIIEVVADGAGSSLQIVDVELTVLGASWFAPAAFLRSEG